MLRENLALLRKATKLVRGGVFPFHSERRKSLVGTNSEGVKVLVDGGRSNSRIINFAFSTSSAARRNDLLYRAYDRRSC